MDKIQKFRDIVNTVSRGQGLALQSQLLSPVPQGFPLLSPRQHFPIPQPLKQLLGTVFRDFAGQTMLASCCGTTVRNKIFVVLSQVIPSHLLSVTGVIFLRKLWKCELSFRCSVI